MDPLTYEYLEKKHLSFFLGTFLTGTEPLSTGTIYWSESVMSPVLNFVTGVQLADRPLPEWVEEMESAFHKLGRRPCVYSTPNVQPPLLGNLLMPKGYKAAHRDTWMALDAAGLSAVRVNDSHPGCSVVQVGSQEQLDSFFAVFQRAYSVLGDNSTEVQLTDDYRPCWERVFTRSQKGEGASLLLIEKDGKAVAAVALIHDGEAGGLYGFSVLPEVRGTEVERAMDHAALSKARELNLKVLLSQVAAGGEDEKALEKWGFQKLGSCVGLVATTVTF